MTKHNRLGMSGLAVLAVAAGVSTYFTQRGSSPVAASCHYQQSGVLPDHSCTPGALNPSVTQATINSTICVRGWTATIRPPQSVTAPEKRTSMAQYGVTDPTQYEYDHLISLELGGAANDTHNLWPEPHSVSSPSGDLGSFTKDGVENALKRAICSHRITLAAAQQIISTDWTQGIPYTRH